MNSFFELNLPEQLMRALEKMKFSTPTPIQAQAVPVALGGSDILGSAQTGTGKTAAFGIPLIAHLLKKPESAALVMTPTRELAVQVMQALKALAGHDPNMRTALLIGGENMFRQFSQLENSPRIIVGTPGRINDHLSRKSLKLGHANFLVLDETDRMLDMGFGVQIDKVLSYMPKERQTLMFSATLPKNIVSLSYKYTKDAVRIAVGSTTAPAKAIKQDIVRVSQPEKYATLTQQLDARGGSIIVFVRTKHGADRLARKLERESHSASAIHGDLRQNKRDKVIRQFREKKIRILIATDVAARGLDVPHVEHVINYDLPQCPEDYIHRIGRTARAGAEGEALCLVSPEENGKWAAIERLMGGEESEQSHQSRRQPGKTSHRNRNQNGYGRKNDRGFGSGPKRGYEMRKSINDSGQQQERTRKPHRKGQSWQKAHDERKANEAAASIQPAQQRFERKFERRDDKQQRRDDHASKPWQKAKRDGFDKPRREFGDRQDGPAHSDKPWQKKREFGDRQDRPARSDKPWQKRERPEGSGDAKPWHKAKRDGFDKPRREGGEDRPFQKRGGDRPFKKREYNERNERQDRPARSDKPWHKKREHNERQDRPARPDMPWQKKKRFDKPHGQKPNGQKPRFDGDQPIRRKDRNFG